MNRKFNSVSVIYYIIKELIAKSKIDIIGPNLWNIHVSRKKKWKLLRIILLSLSLANRRKSKVQLETKMSDIHVRTGAVYISLLHVE